MAEIRHILLGVDALLSPNPLPPEHLVRGVAALELMIDPVTGATRTGGMIFAQINRGRGSAGDSLESNAGTLASFIGDAPIIQYWDDNGGASALGHIALNLASHGLPPLPTDEVINAAAGLRGRLGRLPRRAELEQRWGHVIDFPAEGRTMPGAMRDAMEQAALVRAALAELGTGRQPPLPRREIMLGAVPAGSGPLPATDFAAVELIDGKPSGVALELRVPSGGQADRRAALDNLLGFIGDSTILGHHPHNPIGSAPMGLLTRLCRAAEIDTAPSLVNSWPWAEALSPEDSPTPNAVLARMGVEPAKYWQGQSPAMALAHVQGLCALHLRRQWRALNNPQPGRPAPAPRPPAPRGPRP